MCLFNQVSKIASYTEIFQTEQKLLILDFTGYVMRRHHSKVSCELIEAAVTNAETMLPRGQRTFFPPQRGFVGLAQVWVG